MGPALAIAMIFATAAICYFIAVWEDKKDAKFRNKHMTLHWCMTCDDHKVYAYEMSWSIDLGRWQCKKCNKE